MLLSIIRSIPKHLATKQSWKTLVHEPKKSFLWLIGPLLFSLNQRKFRDEKIGLTTSLNRLVDLIGTSHTMIPVYEWPREPHLAYVLNPTERNRLSDLLTSHGSDKALLGYASIYQVILAKLVSQGDTRKLSIVEIGIGSKNPALVSNMGAFGIPGASLRAFRDFLPIANIMGGDIDRETFFEEERITTQFVDQLDQNSLNHFLSNEKSYDLLIDDGLHELDANLNTLTAGISSGKIGSWIVIEDISPDKSKEWLAIAQLLNKHYSCWLVNAPHSLVFIATRIS
jgi:hypothetical protein